VEIACTRTTSAFNPNYLIWVAVVIFVAIAIPGPFIRLSHRRAEQTDGGSDSQIGEDLEPGVVIAPSLSQKASREVLTEGRYYLQPYAGKWQVVRRSKSPPKETGRSNPHVWCDLAAGNWSPGRENQKGIVSEVLRPGRYPINAW